MRWKLLSMPALLAIAMPCFSESFEVDALDSDSDVMENLVAEEEALYEDSQEELIVQRESSSPRQYTSETKQRSERAMKQDFPSSRSKAKNRTEQPSVTMDDNHSKNGWGTDKESVATPQPGSQKHLDQRVLIGGSYTYAWITPQKNPKTDGSLGGAQFLYEYRPIDSVYTAAAFNFRIGSTNNDVGKRTLQDYNPQFRAGYTCPKTWFSDRFTFFTGFGVRYMAEKVSVGHTSLHFDYTTLYMPLGFLFEKHVMDHFAVGCNFQWMPQVLPMVRIDLLDGAQWDITYQLGNFAVEFPLTLSFCQDRCNLSFSPFFETWRDGKSTAKTLTHLYLDLPGNTYLFAGLNINVDWSF